MESYISLGKRSDLLEKFPINSTIQFSGAFIKKANTYYDPEAEHIITIINYYLIYYHIVYIVILKHDCKKNFFR